METLKKEACVAPALLGNLSTDGGSRIEDVLCGIFWSAGEENSLAY